MFQSTCGLLGYFGARMPGLMQGRVVGVHELISNSWEFVWSADAVKIVICCELRLWWWDGKGEERTGEVEMMQTRLVGELGREAG